MYLTHLDIWNTFLLLGISMEILVSNFEVSRIMEIHQKLSEHDMKQHNQKLKAAQWVGSVSAQNFPAHQKRIKRLLQWFLAAVGYWLRQPELKVSFLVSHSMCQHFLMGMQRLITAVLALNKSLYSIQSCKTQSSANQSLEQQFCKDRHTEYFF